MQLAINWRLVLTKVLLLPLLFATFWIVAFSSRIVTEDASQELGWETTRQQPRFAFWYEDWTPNTWGKLQPANTFIGVPATAVSEIHRKSGKALNYVTFYQANVGTTFLESQDDLTAVGFHTPQGYLPSAFGGANNYVLCSNSQELRNRVLAYVDQSLRTSRFDGLFVDNAYQPPATTLVCDAKHAHVTPGEDGDSAYVNLLSAVYPAIKKINPSALLIINVGNPSRLFVRSDGHSLWDFCDYLLWESYGYASVVGAGHDRWKETIEASLHLARSRNAKKVLVLSYPKSDAEAFYSYTVARVFGFRYAANLGISEQWKEGSGGHYGIFAPKLPELTGLPSSNPPSRGQIVLRRSYDNGICVLNLGQSGYQVVANHTGRLYLEGRDSKVLKGEKYRLPPGEGSILIY